MWNKFEENFPYFGLVKRQTGINHNQLKEKYRSKIEKINDIDFYSFNRIVMECLDKLEGFGHLNILDPVHYYAYKNVVEEIDDIPANRNIIDIFNKEKPKIIYKHLKDEAPIKNLIYSNYFEPKTNIILRKISDNVAFITIKNPSVLHEKRDKKKLIEYYEKLTKDGCNNIILRLEDVMGGDYYWMNNIVAPNIDEPLSYTYRTFITGGEDVINYYEKLGVELNFNLEEAGKLPNKNEEDFQNFVAWYGGTMKIEPAYSEKKFDGNIYYLIDNKVYSAAEGLAQFSKQTGFATLVGTNSRGDGLGGGGTPLMDSLPNSGLIFRYRIAYAINDDGSSNVEFGTSPDYYSNEGETPLDTCIRIIEEKEKSKILN